MGESRLVLNRKTRRGRVQFYTTGKPWRIVGTRRLAGLGEVRLYEDRLVARKGPVRMEHLRLSLHDFSVIVPLVSRNSLVFEWNYRHVLGGWELELPAGLIETGETPLECARRELMEETGYTRGTWKKIGWMYTLPGITGQKAHVFLAGGLNPGLSRRELNEMMSLTVLSVREAYRLLGEGLIVHAPTIVALAFARNKLLKG